MAKKSQARKLVVPLNQLHPKLAEYKAQFYRDSSTEKGHVYFSAPVQMWILVLRKGNNAELTFHQECPCSLI